MERHQHWVPLTAVGKSAEKGEKCHYSFTFHEQSKTLLLIRVRAGVSERDEYVRPMW
jgi:hypothetical protein